MQAQTDRLGPTIEEMAQVLTHPRTTLLAVPLAAALAIGCIVRGRRTEAVPFLVCSSIVLATFLLVYWNSAVTLHSVLLPALGRVLMGLIVLAWLLVPALAYAAVASSETYPLRRSRGAVESRTG